MKWKKKTRGQKEKKRTTEGRRCSTVAARKLELFGRVRGWVSLKKKKMRMKKNLMDAIFMASGAASCSEAPPPPKKKKKEEKKVIWVPESPRLGLRTEKKKRQVVDGGRGGLDPLAGPPPPRDRTDDDGPRAKKKKSTASFCFSLSLSLNKNQPRLDFVAELPGFVTGFHDWRTLIDDRVVVVGSVLLLFFFFFFFWVPLDRNFSSDDVIRRYRYRRMFVA